MYSVRGRNAATTANADHAIWGFWNPHSTQRIRVVSFAMWAQTAVGVATFAVRLRRTSARGTPGSTVTANSSSDSKLGAAPLSGALLDLAAYSAQPTLLASAVDFTIGFTLSTTVAAGFVYPVPGGIEIGPGAGIAMIQVPATISAIYEITLTWLEDWV